MAVGLDFLFFATEGEGSGNFFLVVDFMNMVICFGNRRTVNSYSFAFKFRPG